MDDSASSHTVESLEEIYVVLNTLSNFDKLPMDLVQRERVLFNAISDMDKRRKKYDENKPLKPESFIRKVERIDASLRDAEDIKEDLNTSSSFSSFIKVWQDKHKHDGDWQQIKNDFASKLESLRVFVDAFERVRRHPSRSKTEIRIGTTPLLSTQFWPAVVQRFRETDVGRQCAVKFRTASAYAWHGDGVFVDSPYDIILSYCTLPQLNRCINSEESFSPSDSLAIRDTRLVSVASIGLHRCLLLPRNVGNSTGTDGSAAPYTLRLGKMSEEEVSSVLKNYNIVIPADPELIIPGCQWENVKALAGSVDQRRLQFEMHAYVRSGLGGAISHVEFLTPEEEQFIDARELPDSYGKSKLALFRVKKTDGRTVEIDTLWDLASEKMRELSASYEQSGELDGHVRRFTRFTRTKGLARSGEISLAVTRTMIVKGVASHGRSISEGVDEIVTGTISKSGDQIHMELRSVGVQNREDVRVALAFDGDLRQGHLKAGFLERAATGKESVGVWELTEERRVSETPQRSIRSDVKTGRKPKT